MEALLAISTQKFYFKGPPYASFSLLASCSSSSLIDEVAFFDPPRLQADIVNQLYNGTTISSVRDD